MNAENLVPDDLVREEMWLVLVTEPTPPPPEATLVYGPFGADDARTAAEAWNAQHSKEGYTAVVVPLWEPEELENLLPRRLAATDEAPQELWQLVVR